MQTRKRMKKKVWYSSFRRQIERITTSLCRFSKISSYIAKAKRCMRYRILGNLPSLAWLGRWVGSTFSEEEAIEFLYRWTSRTMKIRKKVYKKKKKKEKRKRQIKKNHKTNSRKSLWCETVCQWLLYILIYIYQKTVTCLSPLTEDIYEGKRSFSSVGCIFRFSAGQSYVSPTSWCWCNRKYTMGKIYEVWALRASWVNPSTFFHWQYQHYQYNSRDIRDVI